MIRTLFVAVFSGEGQLTGGLIEQAGLKTIRKHNELYVFALAEQR